MTKAEELRQEIARAERILGEATALREQLGKVNNTLDAYDGELRRLVKIARWYTKGD